MKSKIIVILFASLLAGPITANAAVIYDFAFRGLAGVDDPPLADFQIVLTFDDFVTTTGLAATSSPIPTSLGYDVVRVGTNRTGTWAFVSPAADAFLSDGGFRYGTGDGSYLSFTADVLYITNYVTEVGTYRGNVVGNAPFVFDGTFELRVSQTPEPAALGLLGIGLAGLGFSRRKKA